MRFIINIFQLILVAFWCIFCAAFGVLVMLVTWNSKLTVYFIAVKVFSPVVLWLSGVKLKIEGRENINKDQPFIYVANHESQLDIPVVCLATELPLFFIAKKELRKIPIVGWYMIAVGHIFIDRSNKERAQASMIKAAEMIKGGKNVISFPEGTRNKDGKMNIFKRGSFVIAKRGNIGVVPIAIKGTREVLASGSFMFHPGKVGVKIGTPVYPNEHPDLGIDDFANLLRNQVIDLRNQLP
ncbi:MAG: 1-acyl-sn-glycerol-3-phosphate acyltransferase [Flavobacteriales bacterium]|nr:1-acyl-sn-glycerol-3-phosphate acyltransferase [Flavobacteriales bacterium]